jgi:hypothetical protein
MSKIQNVKIDWMEGWGNSPRIEVLFDKLPNQDELAYECADNCYLAIEGDYASFWTWNGNGNNRGMGGHEFDIHMRDGSTVTLRGPWSSNSQAMNERFPMHVVEASVTDNPVVFARGYTFNAAAVTVNALLEYLRQHPDADWRVGIVQNYTGRWYNVVRANGEAKNASDEVIALLS